MCVDEKLDAKCDLIEICELKKIISKQANLITETTENAIKSIENQTDIMINKSRQLQAKIIEDIRSKETQLIENLNENPRKLCDTALEIDLRVTQEHFQIIILRLISDLLMPAIGKQQFGNPSQPLQFKIDYVAETSAYLKLTGPYKIARNQIIGRLEKCFKTFELSFEFKIDNPIKNESYLSDWFSNSYLIFLSEIAI